MVVILASELCSSSTNSGARLMSHALTNASEDAVKKMSNSGVNVIALILSVWPRNNEVRIRFFASNVKLSFSIESSHMDSVPKKRTLDAYCLVECLVFQGNFASLRSTAIDAVWHDVYVFVATASPSAAECLKNSQC